MKKTILIILISFLIIGALGGGVMLIIDPSGEGLGLPIDLLSNSPFNDFLFPGLFLFFVLGVIPLFVLYSLIKKKKYSLKLSLGLGIVLILWIILETVMIRAFSVLQLIYLILGGLIILFAKITTK